MQAEYLGRKVSARSIRTPHGSTYVQVSVNGATVWRNGTGDEEMAIENACRYIDEAEKRPDAYPQLSRLALTPPTAGSTE